MLSNNIRYATILTNSFSAFDTFLEVKKTLLNNERKKTNFYENLC